MNKLMKNENRKKIREVGEGHKYVSKTGDLRRG